MKIRIDWDERYPDYFETDRETGVEIEVTAAEYKMIEEVSESYTRVQELLRNRVEKARTQVRKNAI